MAEYCSANMIKDERPELASAQVVLSSGFSSSRLISVGKIFLR
jgi:hypothetical protein